MLNSSPAPSIALSVSELHKKYNDLHVLKGVSLIARQGEVISILGSSGSGKSTLLRCLNLLEVPTAGKIAIGEEVIQFDEDSGKREQVSAKQVHRLRARVAMVFQSYNLWTHRTVLENIIEAPVYVLKRPRAECIAEAIALLERVGLAEKRNEYPANLSGGQQQRAAIARALALQPAVILFDEPTSALDPELTGEVIKVMREIAEEGHTTMLVVTHEMSFARNVSNRVIFLHQGSIEEDGPPEVVFGAPKSERFKQFIQG